MTNMKNTKRALLSSVLALLLCFTMLLGTTFAWFTDSVTSGSNVIKAGNLDIVVEYTLDGVTWKNLDGANDIFQKGLWEPGHTEIVALKLTNNGSLELNYTARMNIINEIVGKNKAGEDIVLSEILKVNTITMDAGAIGDALLGYYLSDENALTDNESSFKDANILDDNAVLPVGTSKYVIIKVDMPETVGNEANAKDKDSVPSIEFGINVLATQYTAESDSFGSNYDKDAIYYDALATTDAELKAAIIDPKCKVIAVKGDLTYDWGGNSYENSEALYMKGKTIVGFDKNSSITFAGYGSANPITDVTLKNITVKDITVGDNEGSWEHGYLEFVSLKAQNVVFADPIMLDGNSKLVNCSMINNASSWYGIWIEGGNTVIEDCTFSGTRSIKIHEAYSSDVESVVIDNCKIGALSEKPGVVIGDLDATTKVTIKNSTFVSCQPGDQNKYIYESNTDVTTFKFVNENNTTATGVSNVNELTAAIAQGGNIVLGADVQFAATIKNDVAIDLAGNTFEATGSYTLGKDADFTMSNGQYVTNGTYGHIDVRPDTAEGSVITFEDIDFTTTKKNPTYGTCTDRLNSVVEITPNAAGAHVVAVFKNCTFDNAKVLFEGMSGKVGSFEATFENCTFNALTSSSPIEVINYIEGTITVKDCTFNLECTSSSAAAICVSPSNSTAVTIIADNNTINAVAATPHTFDATAGETEVDNIKVYGTPANIKFISSYDNTTVTETNTVKTGIVG